MSIYSIYKITNKITNQVYIGYTQDFQTRIKKHFNPKRSKYDGSHRTKLYKAIKQYGIESFHAEIIYQSIDKDYTHNIMESYFIGEYDSYQNGYNMTKGGTGRIQ